MADCSRMRGHTRVTSQQKKAAQMYFNSMSVHEIASELGVHRTTIWRWFQRPAVRQYYKRLSEREFRKICQRIYDRHMKLLNSDDPIKVNAEANIILDRYLPFT